MKHSILFVLLLLSSTIYCQERYISVEGQQFRIKTIGKGDVTVVFENGMSDSIEIWKSLPDSIAAFAKVFLYDRADIGKSDSSRQARTIPNMVDELNNILVQEEIHGPVVFVGHSMGGLIGRYFASTYPKKVKALFLIDPSPETYWHSMSKRQLNKYKRGGTKWYRTKFEPRYWKEWFQFIPNLEYMQDLHIPPDLPVYLLSATLPEMYEDHEEILKGLNHSKHLELEGTHYVHMEHMEETIELIQELVDL